MDYLPLWLKLRNRPCLVVGGGPVAARKVDTLLRAEAQVTVVAPNLGPELQQHTQAGRVHSRLQPFTATDLHGCVLAIAATNDPAVNQQVADAAAALGIWYNVVDQPALCNFIFPAIVDRSPLIAAISTGGAAPVLARRVKAQLESTLPASYGRLARLAADYRERVRQLLHDPLRRRHFWETILQGPVAELMLAGQDAQAETALHATLAHHAAETTAVGAVYLVGAGPGDPDLLTFRALRLMQQADVLVYDRLVSPEVLALCRKDAEKIYAGKERNRHALAQHQINQLLVDLARSGRQVVRLKGGDPFIFGRGGEELETLLDAGIPFQVVPGITAASGCASYAGIPLTHRDYAHSCVFVAGHRKDDQDAPDWRSLVAPMQTVVIYMGLAGLDSICRQLIAHGAPPERPAALIQQGTTRRQRVWCGTLTSLPGLVHAEDVKPPTLIIIGDVVRLRDKLAWFHEDASSAGLAFHSQAPTADQEPSP